MPVQCYLARILENDMARQQQIKAEIQARITALDLRLKEILEEEARLERERKARLSAPDPVDVELANSFAANKGRFPWPVNSWTYCYSVWSSKPSGCPYATYSKQWNRY